MRSINLLVALFISIGSPAWSASDNKSVSGGPVTPSTIAGVYRVHEPDVIVRLILRPDGQFNFEMIAGAVDRYGKGNWKLEDQTVVLNSDPRPRPAEISAGPITRTGEAPLLIQVRTPKGKNIQGIDLKIGLDDGSVIDSYTQYDGWRPDAADEGRMTQVKWVDVGLSIFDVPPKRFPVNLGAGNAFTFIFTPNDLEMMDFRDLRLVITAEGLQTGDPNLRELGEGLFVRDDEE